MAFETPTAEDIMKNLLPSKSKDAYLKAWTAFESFLTNAQKEQVISDDFNLESDIADDGNSNCIRFCNYTLRLL